MNKARKIYYCTWIYRVIIFIYSLGLYIFLNRYADQLRIDAENDPSTSGDPQGIVLMLSYICCLVSFIQLIPFLFLIIRNKTTYIFSLLSLVGDFIVEIVVILINIFILFLVISSLEELQNILDENIVVSSGMFLIFNVFLCVSTIGVFIFWIKKGMIEYYRK